MATQDGRTLPPGRQQRSPETPALGWWFAIQSRCYATGSQVHTFVYKLKIDPMLRFPAELTAESLLEGLAKDAVIRELGTHPSGSSIR